MRGLLLAVLLLPTPARASLGHLLIRVSKATAAPPPPVGTVELSSPTAGGPLVGVSAFAGNIWVAEARTSGTTSIFKMDQAGATTSYVVGSGNRDIKNLGYDGTYLWACQAGANELVRIDSSGGMTYPATSGVKYYNAAYDGTTLWAVQGSGSAVDKLAVGGATAVNSYTVGTHPIGIAYDGSNMWTANQGSGSVSKVTAGGTVTTYSLTHPASPSVVSFDGAGFMYVAGNFEAWIAKVDITNGSATYLSITSGGLQVGGCYASGNYWTAEYNGGTGFATKVTAGGAMTSYATPNSYPTNCAFDLAHDIWITNPADGYVTKVRVN